MIKKILFLLSFVILLSTSGVSLAADPNTTLVNPLCTGESILDQDCTSTFSDLISNIISYISGIIGVLAVLMFVISGVFFVTSRGDPGRVATAKRIAIYAAVGTAIALLGTGLVEVIRAVIGVNEPAA